MDAYFAPECDAGLIWNEAELGIDWPIGGHEVILSEKDAKLPRLVAFETPFVYSERK
jgi:dTDP-4-dehydrorhamnose 3,5-epimerase